jgi:glycosyltransferase involved in cell wall biosynthesis
MASAKAPNSASALRVAHIVASVAEEAAGPSYSVPSLCRGLIATHWSPQLLTIGTPAVETRSGFLHLRFPADWTGTPILKMMGHSRGLKHAIDEEAEAGAVLHAHGLWLMANVYPGWAARQHGAPLVISPRGMLGAAALNFSKWRKRAMWASFQGGATHAAALFHATSDEEYSDIRRFRLTQPVAVIPNGIDVPEECGPPADARIRKILYLGRLHPKKGLHKLLASWRLVQDELTDCELVIAGPSERGYLQELESKAAELALKRVSFPGPLFGEAKTAAYRSASVFVMPTLNENFGLTVAESLAVGVPVICTKGAPWSGLVSHDCGWWIEGDVDEIGGAMRYAMGLPPEDLHRMGARGRAWMRSDFSWTAIAAEMAQVYDWVKGAGPLPACVRKD